MQGLIYPKLLIEWLLNWCIFLFPFYRRYNRTLLKATCLTGGYICLGLLGNGICKALVTACHFLNQCWLIISKVQWHSSEGNFTGVPQPSITKFSLQIIISKFHSILLGPMSWWTNNEVVHRIRKVIQKGCQGDSSGIHCRCGRQASMSPVNTRAVTLMTFPFQCLALYRQHTMCIF